MSDSLKQARREPRSGEIDTPLFNTIWKVVKDWEIVDGGVRWSATGSDVCAIVDAVQPLLDAAKREAVARTAKQCVIAMKTMLTEIEQEVAELEKPK